MLNNNIYWINDIFFNKQVTTVLQVKKNINIVYTSKKRNEQNGRNERVNKYSYSSIVIIK